MNRTPGVIATAAVVVVMAGLSVWAGPQLPEQVPTHWNAAGEVDGYGSRLSVLVVLPLLALGLGVLLAVLPRIDPRRRNLEAAGRAYLVVWIGVLLLLTGVHAITVLTGLGRDLPVDRFLLAGIGVLFLAIGATIGSVRSNWFLGIRTPWTLSSERSWERTHRLGARLFLVLGALALLSLPLAPPVGFFVLGAGGAVIALVLLGYSYVVWRDDPSRA
jgi:uncharacterized membrane protein